MNKTLIVNTPIRSGQKIYAKNRDLVITNNVSPTAELIADGNIYIYGIMKGRVLAGANGDNSRQIFCSKFYPELISIAGEYLVMEYLPLHYIGQSVQIYFKKKSLEIKLIK